MSTAGIQDTRCTPRVVDPEVICVVCRREVLAIHNKVVEALNCVDPEHMIVRSWHASCYAGDTHHAPAPQAPPPQEESRRPDRDGISDRILLLRLALNIGGNQVAAGIDVPATRYYQWERYGDISLSAAVKLAAFFRVSSYWLIHGEEDPTVEFPRDEVVEELRAQNIDLAETVRRLVTEKEALSVRQEQPAQRAIKALRRAIRQLEAAT